MEPLKIPNNHSNLINNNTIEAIMLANIELSYKAIVIKTTGDGHENKHIDQWTRIESPEVNPHLNGQ